MLSDFSLVISSWEELPFYLLSSLRHVHFSISSLLVYFETLSTEIIEPLVRTCISLLEICALSIIWAMCQYNYRLFQDISIQVRLWRISAQCMISSLIDCFISVTSYPVRYYNSYQFLWYAMSDTKFCQRVVYSLSSLFYPLIPQLYCTLPTCVDPVYSLHLQEIWSDVMICLDRSFHILSTFSCIQERKGKRKKKKNILSYMYMCKKINYYYYFYWTPGENLQYCKMPIFVLVKIVCSCTILWL